MHFIVPRDGTELARPLRRERSKGLWTPLSHSLLAAKQIRAVAGHDKVHNTL